MANISLEWSEWLSIFESQGPWEKTLSSGIIVTFLQSIFMFGMTLRIIIGWVLKVDIFIL